MPQPLPRFDRERMLEQQRRTLERILAEIGDEGDRDSRRRDSGRGSETATRHSRRRSGTSGAVFGSDPLKALLAKESRGQRG